MKLVYYKHNKYSFMPEMLPSKMPFDELTLLLHGTLDYTFDGERIVMKSGDVIYGRENSIRSREMPKDCDYVSFNVVLAEGEVREELPLYLENRLTPEIKLLLSACDEIHAHAENGEDKERLLLLYRCILLQLKESANVPAYGELTNKIRRYVRAHIQEKITLGDIARATFFSSVYCAAVFKRETGQTLMDYIIGQKIEEAKSLVVQGVRLREIADLVGIADYNYFSRVFKKRVGYTPTQYRKFTQK